jgi:hypothetical protein
MQRPCQTLKIPDRTACRCVLPLSATGGKEKPSLELLVEIALYFHVSTDYLLLGRELDKDSVRASLLELSAQMTELAGKL